MAIWTFGDGTILKSGGNVVGKTSLAKALRRIIREGTAEVHVTPLPSAPVPLDPTEDFLLDLFASEIARQKRLSLTIEPPEYGPPIPENLRARIETATRNTILEPYGTVH